MMTLDNHGRRKLADRVELNMILSLCKANGHKSFRAFCAWIMTLDAEQDLIEGGGLDDEQVIGLIRAGRRRNIP